MSKLASIVTFLLILVSLISVSCTAPAEDSNAPGGQTSSSLEGANGLFETTPSDPRIALIPELVTLAKEANDLYIEGDYPVWRELASQVEEKIAELGALDSEFGQPYPVEELGYESQEALQSALAATLIFAGNQAYEAENYDLALEKFNSAIEQEVEQLSAAYSGRGHVIRLRDDIEGAKEALNEAIELNPENAQAYSGLALVAFRDEDDAESAFTYLDQAIEINPEFGRAYGLKGEIAHLIQQNEDAYTYLTTSIALDPLYKWAHHDRASVNRFLGNYEQCISDASEAISLGAEDSWVYVTRGACYYYLERNEEALADYERAIQENSDAYSVAGAHGGKGDIFYYGGEYELAVAEYSLAAEEMTNNPNLYGQRGNAYIFLKEYQKALDDYNTAISLSPTYPMAHFGKAIVYDSQNDVVNAYENYGIYLEIEPADNTTTRHACRRMNELHLYNAENIFDAFLGTPCDRFPPDYSGTTEVDSDSFESGDHNCSNPVDIGIGRDVCLSPADLHALSQTSIGGSNE